MLKLLFHIPYNALDILKLVTWNFCHKEEHVVILCCPSFWLLQKQLDAKLETSTCQEIHGSNLIKDVHTEFSVHSYVYDNYCTEQDNSVCIYACTCVYVHILIEWLKDNYR